MHDELMYLLSLMCRSSRQEVNIIVTKKDGYVAIQIDGYTPSRCVSISRDSSKANLCGKWGHVQNRNEDNTAKNLMTNANCIPHRTCVKTNLIGHIQSSD